MFKIRAAQKNPKTTFQKPENIQTTQFHNTLKKLQQFPTRCSQKLSSKMQTHVNLCVERRKAVFVVQRGTFVRL
jgi:molecular chaperone DnaK (HSP70)